MSSLNAEIKTAIDSFDMDKARELLRDALKDADAETYYLASLAAIDDRQRKQFLEKALELDPFHAEAYKAVNGESAAPAQTEQPSAIVEAPEQAVTTNEPEQPSDEIVVEENAVFVTGKVSADAEDFNIYIIPHTEGTVRTTVRKGAELRVFERGDFDEWYYVEYTSTIGQPIYGWIQAASIEDLQIDGEAVNSTDLPITEFRQNIRDDVLQLIKALENDKKLAIRTANLTSIRMGRSLTLAPAMVEAGITKDNYSRRTNESYEALLQQAHNLPGISVFTNQLIAVTENNLNELLEIVEKQVRKQATSSLRTYLPTINAIVISIVLFLFVFLVDIEANIEATGGFVGHLV